MTTRPDIFDDEGHLVPLGNRISDSGEAMVYRLGEDDGRLVKLHHNPTAATRAKLAALPGLAPDDPSLDPRHRNFAWPLSAVWNASGEAVGVIVPTVPDARSLTALANPKLRARLASEMNWHYLHAVAANVAFLFEYLHEVGFVVGDIKPDNILVDNHALATLIDCDSLQVRDPDGSVYLCPVGSEGFTAPEWIDRRFTNAPRAESADRFGLAVLLYQLLTGAHPWTGEWMGAGDPPPRDQLIRSGDWPFRPGARLRPIPGMVPPDTLSPEMAALFRQAFIAGISDPDARPSAADWHAAICNALSELEPCKKQAHHHHDLSLSECPWCLRVDAGLPDAFPRPARGGNPYAPLVHAFERALTRGDARMAVDLWRENSVLARTDSLVHLAPRLNDLAAGLDALDHWNAGNADDLPALSTLAEDVPILSDPMAFRHEQIDGSAVVPALHRALDAALTIPQRPDIDPEPEGKTPVRITPREAPRLSFRVDAGWQGLRPARLRLNMAKPGRIPALALVDEMSGRLVLSVPAQRISGKLVLEFEQPDQRMVLSLQTASAQAAHEVQIVAPPLRSRTIGNSITLVTETASGFA